MNMAVFIFFLNDCGRDMTTTKNNSTFLTEFKNFV